MSIAIVAGPLVGGAFTAHVTWRWCFYINLPLGGVAFLALLLVYHPPMPKFTWREKIRMVDYLGVFLFSVVLLLALTMGYAWRSAAVILMFVLGGLTTIAFCVWNFKYSKLPILPLSIVRCAPVMFPVLSMFFAFYYFFGLSVYLSTYFQTIHGHSAMGTGLSFLPMIIAMVLTSVSTGFLVRATRHVKPFAIAGGVFSTVAMGLITLLDVDSHTSQNIGYLILPGCAMGFMMQAGIMATHVGAPKEPGAMILATATLNFARSLGGAVGGDLAQVVYNAALHQKGKSAFQEYANTLFSDLTESEVLSILDNPTTIKTLSSTEAQRKLLECVMGGVRDVFYMGIGAGALVLICALLYSSKTVPKKKDMVTKEEYEKRAEANGEASGETNDPVS